MSEPDSTDPFAGFSALDYATVLRDLPLYQHDLELLQTHYHAPDRKITATQMAGTLGMGSHGAANLHYGILARRVREGLGKSSEFVELKPLMLFDWPEGECVWTLRPQVAEALESLGWVSGFACTFPEEVPSEILVEGAVYRVCINAYERNPVARRLCIQHHGCRCVICGFDFGNVYGEIARGFIHVHHLRPLSEIGEEYVIDPVNDLRPVCPNCHAVLHLRVPPYSIEDVIAFRNRNHL
jgi:putative restriction endonuclease